MSQFEFTDRYKALGIPYPNPETMCKGQCEGRGWIPIHFSETDPALRDLWIEAERKQREKIRNGKLRAAILYLGRKFGYTDLNDGWHFVKCPDCKGTGKKP